MSTGSAAGPSRLRPASRFEPVPPVEAAPAERFRHVDLPGMEAHATLSRPAQGAGRPDRRPFRALRWILAAGALIVAAYLGWVALAVWRLEQRIVVQLPATPTSVGAASLPTTPPTGTKALADVAATYTPDVMSELPKGRTLILVMGTDRRPNDTVHWPRSDTMILINLDTTSRTVRAMSIPRDLAVDIPGYGLNKVNSAYLFGEYYKEPGGGKALAVRTISQLFNVPIDYYATINFDGFRTLVDRVGGIDIDVPYSIDDYNYPSDDEGDPNGILHVHFDAGLQHMDGKTALRYARTRHADNDFARNKRQMQVILGVRKSAMSLNLIPSMPSLIDQLAGTVETNIPFDKQVAFAQIAYKLNASDIVTSTIDRQMILPITLPDGTEGLQLDLNAAQPTLESFFGPYNPPDSAPWLMATHTPTPPSAQGGKRRAPTKTTVTSTPTTTGSGAGP
jgi:LCP family protein required for cell wall assembly